MAAPAPTLPKVHLQNTPVSLELLSIIPLETAEKYQVAVFAVEAKKIKLAIVYPDQLKQGFYLALKDLGEKVGKKVELYQTDAASMRYLLDRYRGKRKGGKASAIPSPPASTSIAADSKQPPLFKLGETVAFNYLKRVPLPFARQHRLLCVDFLPPNTYWFLTDKEHQKSSQEALRFIEEKNHLNGNLLLEDKKDVDELLAYYQSQEEQEQEKKEEEKESRREERVAQMLNPALEEEKEQKVAKGVVMPQVQATILSTEEEKKGLAGLFQRVAQNISGEPKEEEEKEEKSEPAAATPAAPGAPAPAAAGAPVPTATIKPEALAAEKLSEQQIESAKKNTTSEEESEIGKLLSKSVESREELKAHIQHGFIPQIVAAVVSYAIHEKASDIHIEAFEDEVRIRYRIDGQLTDIIKLPPDVHAAMVSRIKILSRLRLDETRVPQDGRFDVNFNNAQVDLRVSVMPTVHGEKVVMRILDKSRGISSLEELGLLGLAYQNLVKAMNRPYGICLSTGPTGSGKSTTLYALLNRIATPNVNVVTLEDPVEYEIKGINQSQIRPKIGFTFAEGLRSILRQDPNIIMVGEIRDGETANMATQAALTGHLVLSTLHTNDAAGAIPRLTNMGIEPFLISSSLNVVIGQRLVRRICPNCKQEIALPQGVKDQITQDLEIIARINPVDTARVKKTPTYYQGHGCSQCNGKGYQGRVGIFEVMMMSDTIEDLALKRASNDAIRDQAAKEGMLTMYQDGLLKVVNGITTLDEVLRESANK